MGRFFAFDFPCPALLSTRQSTGASGVGVVSLTVWDMMRGYQLGALTLVTLLLIPNCQW